jgi:hypothetical protein
MCQEETLCQRLPDTGATGSLRDMKNSDPPSAVSNGPRSQNRDGKAVLFNAAVRALSSIGYKNIDFDIGGKKSRRRYVKATAVAGENRSIWIKSTDTWHGLADVVRFPWSKRADSGDDLAAVFYALDDAARRGATHLLAVIGDENTGTLEVARLYSLSDAKRIAEEQIRVCKHPFYLSHRAALVLRAISEDFAKAEAIAREHGEDVLASRALETKSSPPSRARTGKTYYRDPKVREAVLELAGGHCERCGQEGFLTVAGNRYLETHHVVGVADRGPDTMDNVIAVCPNCHRQAHFAVDWVQVERDFMAAIRRRGARKSNK